ncbi:hypothetical protein [uncultured Vibrio sp.]|uniref:hypothetical protein n=1 Tax=uncultured Vibrio sp. TaxID=114054 RepID=UPI0025CC6D9E|nr:hypothetical protein [uncultured Vibrio sp.]
MNNPKVFLLLFALASVVLFGLIKLSETWHQGDTSNQTIESTVLNNTLTQSIDGHRRYLTLAVDGKDPVVISVSPSIQCGVGRTALISTVETLLPQKKQYKYLSCQ